MVAKKDTKGFTCMQSAGLGRKQFLQLSWILLFLDLAPYFGDFKVLLEGRNLQTNVQVLLKPGRVCVQVHTALIGKAWAQSFSQKGGLLPFEDRCVFLSGDGGPLSERVHSMLEGFYFHRAERAEATTQVHGTEAIWKS